RMLCSTSVIKKIEYSPQSIEYSTYDGTSHEEFRLTSKPESIILGENRLPEKSATPDDGSGWTWKALDKGGVLRVWHKNADKVTIRL
ncbi:MAG TPA: hypothetical protein VE870_01015, partial [Bacteroidales bacterium]|nr:hypothetical protein [Bacteroidales bacterium]